MKPPSRHMVFWILIICCVACMEGEVRSEPDSLATCDKLYAEGDLAGSEAMARAILSCEAESYPAAWKLSRALISAANLETDKKKSEKLFLDARTYAQTAVDLNPQGTRGFTCLAICYGSLSGFAKGRRMIELAEDARYAAQMAIDLDDRNDLAFLVLGVWNREIATVGGLAKFAAKVIYGGVPEGASLENSEFLLRRAVTLAPEHLNHHLELGITLLAMDRLEEAIGELEIAAYMVVREPEDGIYAETALELLEDARQELEDSKGGHW